MTPFPCGSCQRLFFPIRKMVVEASLAVSCTKVWNSQEVINNNHYYDHNGYCLWSVSKC